jgi:uncharacterized membrane protein (UPF0136 family)
LTPSNTPFNLINLTDLAVIAAIGYGILAIAGGILGYIKAGSQTSLISGLISGILLVGAGIAHQQNASWGLPLAVIITVSLIGVFAVRYLKTRKFMPSGLMVLAGLLAIAGLSTYWL